MSASDPYEHRADRSASPMDIDGSDQPVLAPVIPPPPSDAAHPASPHSGPTSELQPESASRILFYRRHEPYFEFTNFAPYTIDWDGHRYPTAEHLFQAQKFMSIRPDLADRIRNLPNPRAALEEAGRMRRLQRTDWFDVNLRIMDEILEAKFTQHPELKHTLLSTDDSELIEDSPVDSFWGCGENGEGQNELGKALMRLRDKLKRSD
ncbi:uncharacterized protein B0H18DRAFT_55553 [Fomitopsis serialis]|uniref:uncharacterized protein n=1 Tax=Fomitopsis serialis TaxID=139415 RepID=UPI0020079137|nr:uncharacterized protein B0H18DRAFT_55553 [Neoantrodia serialis]KAH9932382.1 hypothetical protein B0H18DRAFT_55553 [Neoantrodia serialis]